MVKFIQLRNHFSPAKLHTNKYIQNLWEDKVSFLKLEFVSTFSGEFLPPKIKNKTILIMTNMVYQKYINMNIVDDEVQMTVYHF